MTHIQQLLADALAAQAEAAAEDYSDAWSAVTSGAITAAEYWQALSSDIEEKKEACWEGHCQAEEQRRQQEDPNGYWLDRIRALVGLPPRH